MAKPSGRASPMYERNRRMVKKCRRLPAGTKQRKNCFRRARRTLMKEWKISDRRLARALKQFKRDIKGGGR